MESLKNLPEHMGFKDTVTEGKPHKFTWIHPKKTLWEPGKRCLAFSGFFKSFVLE